MLGNRHDTWQAFRETHREFLARSGLPAGAVRSEPRFRDLLNEGEAVVSGALISLNDLDAPQWTALYQFATAFFREVESFAPEDRFPAFCHEARRRGDTFPR